MKSILSGGSALKINNLTDRDNAAVFSTTEKHGNDTDKAISVSSSVFIRG
jgi:hypothetical protein